MGVMDKFLNYMKLNDEEDEGFYDDDYLDDEEEVEPVKKFGAAKNRQQAQDEEALDDKGKRTSQPKVTRRTPDTSCSIFQDYSNEKQPQIKSGPKYGSLCDQTYFCRGCTGDYRDTSGEPDSGTEPGRSGCGYCTEDH